MKKNLSILLSSFALISLISCNTQKPSSHQNSKIETSIESVSSERSEVISSNPIDSTDDTTSSSSISDSTSNSSIEETYYHVTFVNFDETVLYETDVLEGCEAVYRGETPTREEDQDFTYKFDGWDKDLTSIFDDMTTMAVYMAVDKTSWSPIDWF